jgi:hypothetical protein
MAITTGRSPIIMDAVGDDLQTVFQPRDANKPTPGVVRVKVVQIRYVAAASGKGILTHGPAGQTIFESANLSAGQADETAYAGAGIWMDNLYVAANPVDGSGAGGRFYIDYV